MLRSLIAGAAILALTAQPLESSLAVFHHPRVPRERPAAGSAAGWASSNWSGYAISGAAGQFTSVIGTWIVQAAAPTKRSTFSSQWVGIDGFNNGSLIQTGTESDYYRGAAHYSAWWEILPAPETVIPSITVTPGDRMFASVTQNGGSSWTITITDETNGQSFTTQQTYNGPQSSAEWIEEAPTVGGRIATLSHYGTTTFDGLATTFANTVNGLNPNFTAAESGVMIQNGAQVSTPSVPDIDTDGFNMQYGPTAPAPPAS